MSRISKIILGAILLAAMIAQGFIVVGPVQADTGNLQAQVDSDNAQIAALNKKIAEYQAKLNELGADKKTLQDAIKSLDLQKGKIEAQVSLTQRQINSTQTQIQQLGGQISDTEHHIDQDKEALGQYLKSIQQADQRSLLVKILSDGDLSQFWNDLDSAMQVQSAVRERTESLKDHEQELSESKTAVQQKQDTLTAQKQTLTSQQQSLAATVNSKSQLLKQTKAQESQYQKLLAAAQAELESYSTFTQNAGGANLIPHNAPCDDWGCYYNQRDAYWGGQPLNGTKYTLASDGCLVSAMAMVLTHYGHRTVTPATINANSSNFASYYPAFLLYTIYADGVSATRTSDKIDAILAGGEPAVVGVHAYGGTHFVVLTSGSHGNYTMKDPYIAAGNNISFTAHYSVRSVYSISRVVIGS